MKKNCLSGGMLLVLLMWLTAVAAAPTDFTGEWALDKAKSEGVPEQLSAMTLTVAQDGKQIKVETKITAAQGAQTGGAQLAESGRRGRRGGRAAQLAMPSPSAVYSLDGAETAADLEGRVPGKETRTAKWLNDGKTLGLTTVRKVTARGNEVTINIKEHWELAEGGKTLQVHRTVETPRGNQEFKLAFKKQ